jgi:hypothetical protein
MECKRSFIFNIVSHNPDGYPDTKYTEKNTSRVFESLWDIPLSVNCGKLQNSKAACPIIILLILHLHGPMIRIIASYSCFSFTDQNNTIVSEKTFDNKIYIANFFFTSCGSICPLMTQHLLKVQNAFPANDHIGFISLL